MNVTVWAGANDHDVPADEIVPWLYGIHGSLDTVVVGEYRINVDPSIYGRPGIRYIIEIDGIRRYLSEAWVLPWMHGLALHHGIRPEDIEDRDAADRARRVQALMVGHQRGWFTYHGFTHANKGATS